MAKVGEKNETREFLKDFKLCKGKEKICNPVACLLYSVAWGGAEAEERGERRGECAVLLQCEFCLKAGGWGEEDMQEGGVMFFEMYAGMKLNAS